MQFTEEDEEARIRRLTTNPQHEEAHLWFENDPCAKYALLTIRFEGEPEIQIKIPNAKACIIEIIQKVYDRDKGMNEKPATLLGRRRRGRLAEEYRIMHIYAQPLADSTVTHYMIDIQREIRTALRLPEGRAYPDYLFERGKPWGVQIRSPGIVVHRDKPEEDPPHQR